MFKQVKSLGGHTACCLAFLLAGCGPTALGPVGPDASLPRPEGTQQTPGVENRKASVENPGGYNGSDPVPAALDEGLVKAASEGHWLDVVAAVDGGLDATSLVGAAGITELHIACLLGDLEEAQKLVEQGAEVSLTTARDETPLHLAALSGATGLIGMLIDAGAVVAAVDHGDRSVLHWAILAGRLDVVKYLVTVQSVPATFDPSGFFPPLVEAIQSGHLEIVEFLVSEGADATQADADGFTPLHHAATKNELDIGTFLVSKGAKASARDDSGKTSLHVLAQNCRLDESCLMLAEFLVKKGSKKASVDADGNMAWDYAVMGGNEELMSYLSVGK